MINAIFFDFNGVIIDDEHLQMQVMEHLDYYLAMMELTFTC